MLKELVEAAERFRGEGLLPPVAYKPKRPRWTVNLVGGTAYMEGPYAPTDTRPVFAPDRQRSGTVSEHNVKPYLLVADGRQVFGKPESGSEKHIKEASLLHEGFVSLLQEAWRSTGLSELGVILEFLRSPGKTSVMGTVGPRDLVAFRVDSVDPTEKPEVQEFWARYLAEELALDKEGQCAACGASGMVLRILPREVVVLGQKCQVISFNRTAFASFGKEQNANAPLCFKCASGAVDALDYMIRSQRHHRILVRNPKGNGLQDQLAVYWLKRAVTSTYEGRTYDFEELLGALVDQDDGPKSGPPAELGQMEAFLQVPWTGDEHALGLEGNSFRLAILSANQGRLVVREWFDTSIEGLKQSLRAFVEATRLVDPFGQGNRAQSISMIIRANGSDRPDLARELVRTAMLGFPPPPGLLSAAVGRFRVPNVLGDVNILHGLGATLKLCLTHRRKEAETMIRLDATRKAPAYLCGRLLAVLEEVQQRAAERRLDTTIVDRFYGSCATAPGTILPILLGRAQSAHLPKIRKENRGYEGIQRLLEDIVSGLDQEGFPRVLGLSEQAEFALGFYHQRADFRAARTQDRANAVSAT